MRNFKEDAFTFGKYKGELLEDVVDIEYLHWVLEEGDLDPNHKPSILFAENIEMRLADLEI